MPRARTVYPKRIGVRPIGEIVALSIIDADAPLNSPGECSREGHARL